MFEHYLKIKDSLSHLGYPFQIEKFGEGFAISFPRGLDRIAKIPAGRDFDEAVHRLEFLITGFRILMEDEDLFGIEQELAARRLLEKIL